MAATEPAAEQPEGALPPGIDPAEHRAVLLDNALLRAGVDLDTDQGKLIKQAYAGADAPDVEAIKSQWELIRPAAEVPAPPVEERIAGEEHQGAERSALAASSKVEPNPMDRDPNEEAIQAGEAVLTGARSGTFQDAVATGLHHIFVAGGRGDARVMVTNEPSGAQQ